MKTNKKTSSSRVRGSKLRVGIWCAYHVTLEQSEGIGVFAHNLARGLASLNNSVSVTMAARPGDEHLMAETVAVGKRRINVACPQPQAIIQPVSPVRKRIAEGAQWLAQIAEPKFSKYDNIAVEQRNFIKRTKRSAWKRMVKLAASAASLGREPTMYSDEEHMENEWQRIIDSCDVWLLPYVGLDRHFSKPTVVTVHDLVCYHFPEVLSPEHLEIFKKLAERVSADADMVTCMSKYIRDNDLLGVLGLAPEKVQYVESAAPTDFGKLGDFEQANKINPILNEQYVFYPSAFRSYKNHELLISALGKLRHAGNENLNLVFTGIHAPPPAIHDLIQASGLEDRVHILGKVPRDVLSLLYQRALATIVPSRYEQGSFPLMEALHWGSPIACSRIPALTELMGKMGDDMRYFDTDNVNELVGVIEEIIQHRPEILARQQARKSEILGRTWAEAAVNWRQVLEKAIERHEQQAAGGSQATSQAAA